MKNLKTRAIVLRRMELGEADRLVGLFTEERGKVKAVNRGARKVLSKLAGHLEPFVLLDCQLQEGRTFYTITSADTIEPFLSIRNDLKKTSLACYFLELVDALTVDEQAQPVVFDLLYESLLLLNSLEAENDTFLVNVFTLRLLIELGYRPELFHCIHCHVQLEPTDNRFSASLGGLLGPECKKEDDAAIPVSTDTIKVMRIIADGRINVITRLDVPTPVLQELAKITENYLHYQTGREMRSAGFMALT
jgi:DNA repair protein RecO (recombination protein O)